MKYATERPFADPEKAARRLLEIASTVEPVQDGRLHIEKINAPLFTKGKMPWGKFNKGRKSILKEGGSPAEYKAGLDLAIARG